MKINLYSLLLLLLLFVSLVYSRDCAYFTSFQSNIIVNNASWCQSDITSLSYVSINIDIPNNNNNSIPTYMTIRTSSYSRYDGMKFGICLNENNQCNNTHIETNTTVSDALQVSNINFYWLVFELFDRTKLFNLTRIS